LSIEKIVKNWNQLIELNKMNINANLLIDLAVSNSLIHSYAKYSPSLIDFSKVLETRSVASTLLVSRTLDFRRRAVSCLLCIYGTKTAN